MIQAEDEDELIFRANESLRRVDVWMRKQNLKLAPQKTEAVILKGPRKRSGVRLRLREVEIIPTRAVRYLGITLDDIGSFGTHIKNVAAKAEKRAAALSRLMANAGGPSNRKREILNGAVQSIMLYGAPVWHMGMRINSYRKVLERVQRQMTIRVVSAYRTVSTLAVQVVAGIIPIDLMVEERRYIFEKGDGHLQRRRTEARRRTMGMWQRRWNENLEVGQWTKKLIPDIEPWVKCGHRRVDYFMTQLLTGHGSFRVYTKRIGKTEDDKCVYCGREDTVEHTFFHCNRWENERREVAGRLQEDFCPENIVKAMMDSKDIWDVVSRGMKEIMSNKEAEERAIRQEQEAIEENPNS